MLPSVACAAGKKLSHHAASPSGGKRVTFAQLGQTTRTLSGYNPTADVFIPVPGGFAVGQNSTLAVEFSQSALLNPRTSTVSVSVNGANVAGELLNFKPGVRETLMVRVPSSDLLKQGVNHIAVAFSLNSRAAVAACGITSPDVNVTLYGSSWFQYDVRASTRDFVPALQTLPSPFASPGSPISAPIVAALPSHPDPSELTAAGRVLARFGEDLSSSPPRVITTDASSLAGSAQNANLLMVGTPSDNPALPRSASLPFSIRSGHWVGPRGRVLAPDEGLIYEAANPQDRRYAALVVSGNGDTGIQRAAVILASGTMRQLLHGSYALVPTAPYIPPETVAAGHTVALGALGYNSTTVEGFGERDVTISFELSQRTSQNGSFTLIFSHGEVSQAGTSSVRVDLNNQPVAGRVLHSSDPDKITWTITLPAGQFLAGQNTITVRFFLVLPEGCSVPPAASSWALVDNTSTLFLPASATGGTADLGLLPFPLVKNGSPDDSLLVLPDSARSQYGALQLAELIGTKCRVDAPLLNVTTASQADQKTLVSHVVLVDGMPAENALLRSMDPHLPVRLSAGLHVSADSQALKTTLKVNAALGLIEEIPAPWGPTKTAIVVTASDPALLPVTSGRLFSGLSGNVATVTSSGTVSTFETATRAPFTVVHPTGRRPVALFTGAGLVCALVLAVASLLRRRRPGAP